MRIQLIIRLDHELKLNTWYNKNIGYYLNCSFSLLAQRKRTIPPKRDSKVFLKVFQMKTLKTALKCYTVEKEFAYQMLLALANQFPISIIKV